MCPHMRVHMYRQMILLITSNIIFDCIIINIKHHFRQHMRVHLRALFGTRTTACECEYRVYIVKNCSCVLQVPQGMSVAHPPNPGEEIQKSQIQLRLLEVEIESKCTNGTRTCRVSAFMSFKVLYKVIGRMYTRITAAYKMLLNQIQIYPILHRETPTLKYMYFTVQIPNRTINNMLLVLRPQRILILARSEIYQYISYFYEF